MGKLCWAVAKSEAREIQISVKITITAIIYYEPGTALMLYIYC